MPHRRFCDMLQAGLKTGAAGLLCQLCACSSLPSTGPLKSDIEDEYQPKAQSHPFELVTVSDATIRILQQRAEPSFAGMFGANQAPPPLMLGAGDVVSISIWEAGSQPLLASAGPSAQMGSASVGSRAATLPAQTVGADGTISVPFAGQVMIAGRSLPEAQQAIATALARKASMPQVVISVVHDVANTVTVVGEITGGGRVELSPHGDRVLDVIASAGGVRAPSYETWVRLTRGQASVSVPLSQVINDPRENVYLRPADTLLVYRRPETFTVFGAAGRNAQIPFEATHVNLIEAIAKSGGLVDTRSDPRGVYLMRPEPSPLAAALSGAKPGRATTMVPVVYSLDLTKAGDYFLARNFELRDGDVLYVSDAPANELQKFLIMVGLIAQPAIEGAIVNSAVK